MRQPTIHSVRTPTGNVVCYEWPKDASTVVLLTGMGVPAQSWWNAENEPMLQEMMAEPYFLAPVLARKYRVLAYNRAGIGESNRPQHPRTLGDLLAELEAVLDGLTSGPVILLGHSLGGLVAFEYARQHPDKVSALVLLDTSHPHQLQRLDRWKPASEQAAYRTVMSRTKEEHPEKLDFLNIFCGGNSVAGSLGDLPLLVISRGIPATAQELQTGEEPLTTEISEQLATEWQHMQADLAAASGKSTHLIAQKSRHYPHFDQPRWTASQIMQFLDGLDS